ncbi:MAG: isoprenylcysteine carboxylmethyltransferase family protein [Chlorobi bacterium]|nr:isoprenylcysteine carboxylmethyltransferase family protein [Chlorobiota bacterium]
MFVRPAWRGNPILGRWARQLRNPRHRNRRGLAIGGFGPFAYVRNPLYVGNILLYTGFGIMANLWWLVVITLLWFLFQYHLIVSREEEFLAKKFGPEYEKFRQHVPRFLPRFTPYQGDRSTTIHWTTAFRSERRTFQAFGIALALMVARWGLLQ